MVRFATSKQYIEDSAVYVDLFSKENIVICRSKNYHRISLFGAKLVENVKDNFTVEPFLVSSMTAHSRTKAFSKIRNVMYVRFG